MFQLLGHHYHNKKLDENQGVVYLQKALLKNLRQEEVAIPMGQRQPGGPAAFPVKKLGIGYPVVLDAGNIDYDYKLTVEDFDDREDADKKEGDKQEKPARRAPAGPMGMGAAGGAAGASPKTISAPRFDFIVQFCWQAPSPDEMAKIAREIPSGEPIVADAAGDEADPEAGEPAEGEPAAESDKTAAGDEMTDEAETKPEGDESAPAEAETPPAKQPAEGEAAAPRE